MEERTEINLDELKAMIQEMGLEQEFDLMMIGSCSVCCQQASGGNC